MEQKIYRGGGYGQLEKDSQNTATERITLANPPQPRDTSKFTEKDWQAYNYSCRR